MAWNMTDLLTWRYLVYLSCTCTLTLRIFFSPTQWSSIMAVVRCWKIRWALDLYPWFKKSFCDFINFMWSESINFYKSAYYVCGFGWTCFFFLSCIQMVNEFLGEGVPHRQPAVPQSFNMASLLNEIQAVPHQPHLHQHQQPPQQGTSMHDGEAFWIKDS